MFITKKHIPRRTFLRGAGVTLALPLLESMVPALTPLRLTAAGPGEALCRHLAPAWRGAGLLESAAGRQGLRLFVHHEAAGAIPQSRGAHHRPRHAGGDGHRRRARRRPCARRGPAVRRPPATKRREPLSGRHDRSNDREEVRPGHDPVVHSARRRRHRQLRQLQLGLQLRVHELDLLVVADAAAADGSESARGLRAPVRRRARARRSGWLAESRTPAFSIRSRASFGSSRTTSARAIGPGSTPISRTFVSSSGGSRLRWATP